MAFASAASTVRPVRLISSARDWPTLKGRISEATGGSTASWISGWANMAPGCATTQLQKAASSIPPPRHWPLTAATVGMASSTSRRNMPWKASSMRRGLLPHVLGHAGAEGEVLARAAKAEQLEVLVAPQLVEQGVDLAHHLAVEDVGLGRVEHHAQRLPVEETLHA